MFISPKSRLIIVFSLLLLLAAGATLVFLSFNPGDEFTSRRDGRNAKDQGSLKTIQEGDDKAVSIEELDEVPLEDTIEISSQRSVTIHDGAEKIELVTEAKAVGEILEEAGILLSENDKVDPPLSGRIAPDVEIIVHRAKPYSLQVDGTIIETSSHHTSTLDILEEAGIGLSGEDYVRPDVDSTLNPGDTIEVIRVTDDYEIQEESLPFSSVLVATDELEIDQRAVLNQGMAGIQQQLTRIHYENGQEVSRSPAGEWIARQPADEVIGYGTNIIVRTLDTPAGPIEYWRVVRMRVTSYTAASAGRSPDHPSYGITASGLPAGKGVVAIDPNVVPFGSQVYVEGYGIGVAGDTGGGIKGRIIDLGYDEGELVSWRGSVDVYYLTPIPAPENINYLIP
ncbi:MAG: G5 domain-containing protein [Chloroflexota bacterium]|jgi:uncharacterized protein YabE (DUF348 family)/3D (Asp-Asp-Asp) domain-containing protein